MSWKFSFLCWIKVKFCLLTYFIVQSPSWEANQEIPHISRNLKVHYRTHKRPPPVPILGRPNSVHIPTSHLLEIHSNIIHPSMPRSPQWSLSLRFPHQDPIHIYQRIDKISVTSGLHVSAVKEPSAIVPCMCSALAWWWLFYCRNM